MPQLDVTTFPSQIFWLLVCFGILCFVVTLFLVPRLAKPIQQRLDILHNHQAEAERLLKEAEELAHANKEALNSARYQATSQLHQAINEAQTLRMSRLQSFDLEIQKQLHDLQQKVQVQQQDILNNSKELVTQIVQSLFVKLTHQPVTHHLNDSN